MMLRFFFKHSYRCSNGVFNISSRAGFSPVLTSVEPKVINPITSGIINPVKSEVVSPFDPRAINPFRSELQFLAMSLKTNTVPTLSDEFIQVVYNEDAKRIDDTVAGIASPEYALGWGDWVVWKFYFIESDLKCILEDLPRLLITFSSKFQPVLDFIPDLVCWTPALSSDVLTVNVDAAKRGGIYRTGRIGRYSDGRVEFKDGKSYYYTPITNSLVAETYAIFDGLEAAQLVHKKVLVLNDNFTAVKYVNEPQDIAMHPDFGILHALHKKIWTLQRKFDSVDIGFCFREQNRVADFIAGNEGSWVSNFETALQERLMDDIRRKKIFRTRQFQAFRHRIQGR